MEHNQQAMPFCKKSAADCGRMLLKKWWLIVAAAVLFGAVTGLWMGLIRKPVYRAVMTCAVISTETEEGPTHPILAARDVTDVIQQLLVTDAMAETLHRSNEDMQSFTGNLQVVRAGESNLLTVFAECSEKVQALEALETLAQILPSTIAYLSDSCTIRVVQQPTVQLVSDPAQEAGKDSLCMAALGAGIMALLLCGIYIHKANALTKPDAPLQRVDLFAVAGQFKRHLKRFWAWLLIAAVCAAGLSGIYARISYVPVYRATARFTVHSAEGTTFMEDPATQQLAKSFQDVVQMPWMQELLRRQLDTEQINGTISAVSVAQTNLFELTVCSGDSRSAVEILQAVLECYPKVAAHMADDPRIVIREAVAESSAPCNPFSWAKPVLSGGAVGIALGLGILLLMAFGKNHNRYETVNQPTQNEV